MSEQLKPCPFCGGEAEYDNDEFGEWIGCTVCGSSGRFVSFTRCNKAAIDAWNQRHTDTELTRLRQALVKAAMPLEAINISGRIDDLSPSLQQGIKDGLTAICEAIKEHGK